MGRKETKEAIADSRAGRVTRIGSVSELNADDVLAEAAAAGEYPLPPEQREWIHAPAVGRELLLEDMHIWHKPRTPATLRILIMPTKSQLRRKSDTASNSRRRPLGRPRSYCRGGQGGKNNNLLIILTCSAGRLRLWWRLVNRLRALLQVQPRRLGKR